jgi:phosphate ABC transporter permease subunit PstA
MINVRRIRQEIEDKLYPPFFIICGFVSLLTILSIVGLIIYFSLPLIKGAQFLEFFKWHWHPFNKEFGILPMILGSILLSFSSLILAYPLGLFICLFACGIGPKILTRFILVLINFMTSIPTVIYGFVSVFLLVPLIRDIFEQGNGFSYLTAILTLSIMILPTIVLVINSQMKHALSGVKLTTASLGIDKTKELLWIVIPVCSRALIAGFVLGFTRALGDTIIPLMVSGNAPQIPHSVLNSFRTLTAHIALVVATDSFSKEYYSLFFCGLILFFISATVNLTLKWLEGKSLSTIPVFYLTKGEKLIENIVKGFSWISFFWVIFIVVALVGFLIIRGIHVIDYKLFFGDVSFLDAINGKKLVLDGIWPACVGTFYLVFLTGSFAIPVGIGSGIYLSEYAPQRLKSIISIAVDFLAGIPSIVMGLFGFMMILFFKNTFLPNANTCLLVSSICIALLVLPYIIKTTQNTLQNIPQDIKITGLSLGISKIQNLFHVLLPYSAKGIFSGIILAIGRAAEDTAVILLTGVVANANIPRSITDKFEALPFNIYYLAAEFRTTEQLNQAFGSALILLTITSSLFKL